jgi:hypothetical protein
MKRLLFAALLIPFLTACSDTTAPEGTAPVEVRFATTADGAALRAAPAAGAIAAVLEVPSQDGAYVIDDLRVIVSELELEGTDTCLEEEEDGEIEYEECEFESGPMLVDLPLDGGMVSLGTGFIAEGEYTFVEFEVEDLDLDDEEDAGEEDGEKHEAVAGILTEVQGIYPDFPADASMVVHGQFVPATGDPQEFTVYFDAEIEIELPLDPPLVVPDDDALTIQVDPAVWFSGLDLMALNGQTVELEVEHGFEGVEIEHDDD